MVTVSIFSKHLKYDRYHLLKPSASITDSPIYEESGIAFNGFDKPVILNTSVETVYDSRMGKIVIDGFNGSNPVYFLINDVKPITSTKCAVFFEIDGWTNYKNTGGIIGTDNYLFETTAQIDYPYNDLVAKFKWISPMEKIENSAIYNVIMLYHDSTVNIDTVYYFAFYRTLGPFQFYSQKFFSALKQLAIDTNNIVGFYLSPFDLNHYFTNQIYEDNPMTFQVFSLPYHNFINECKANPRKRNVYIVDDFAQKTVITDMTGSPVWTSVRHNHGNKKFVYRLDLRYDGCIWDCAIISSDNTDDIQLIHNNRFSISCVDLGFFVDYYQEYQNTQKSINSELRKAQLEKQLIDNIGGVVSSTSSGMIGGLIGGSSVAGAGAGAIGGIANMITNYYSTSDYNRKLEVIEDTQARIQYDTMIPCSNTFFPFIVGETEPSFNLMMIDSQSLKSATYDDSNPYIKYNCRIRSDDLWTLIYSKTPVYLSGDFDFIRMNPNVSKQLNERFKHGIYFID